MTKPLQTVAALTLALFLCGCTNTETKKADTGHDDHSEHNHAADHKGPHDGQIIDLGRSHEYHAELVENEAAGMVTVYILDNAMKELAIDQETITMNLMVDGSAQAFVLTAVEVDSGKASRFDAADKSLFEALHEHEASGKLNVTINGSPFSGTVAHHDHGHEGHDHSDHEEGHDDHDGHDHDDHDGHEH